MGVDLDFWVETIKKHPAKYKFKGLDGYHHTVGEAAVHDDRFMDKWMGYVCKSNLDELAHQLGLPPAEVGEEDQPSVESYADFLREIGWRAWNGSENINNAPARRVIEQFDIEDRREKWADREAIPDFEWDCIRDKDQEAFLLKDHPPEKMWSHAYEQGVDLDEILFVCPGCGREPIKEENVDKAPVKYYCGLCGASANDYEDQGLEHWAECVGAQLWPFKKKR